MSTAEGEERERATTRISFAKRSRTMASLSTASCGPAIACTIGGETTLQGVGRFDDLERIVIGEVVITDEQRAFIARMINPRLTPCTTGTTASADVPPATTSRGLARRATTPKRCSLAHKPTDLERSSWDATLIVAAERALRETHRDEREVRGSKGSRPFGLVVVDGPPRQPRREAGSSYSATTRVVRSPP